MKRAKTVSKKSSQNIRVTVDISRELLGAVEKAGAFYGFDRAKAIRFFLRNALAMRSAEGKI